MAIKRAGENTISYLLGKIKTALGGKLDKSGGVMTGALTLSGAPETDLQAANKGYVDQNAGKTIIYTVVNGAIAGLDTPYETIKTQLNDGKNVILREGKYNYYYTDEAFGLTFFRFDGNRMSELVVGDGTIFDNIMDTYKNLQLTDERTDDISANATSSSYYPSTKGVADYVAAKVKTYTAGDGISISDDNVISAPKTTEMWTFTLADGSTVTKSVVISS